MTEEMEAKVYSARTRSVVCKGKGKGAGPVWNEEFRFDVSDDQLLQDEPLIFKVSVSDGLTSSGSVGLVYVDLNPLIMRLAEEEDEEKGGDERGKEGGGSEEEGGDKKMGVETDDE